MASSNSIIDLVSVDFDASKSSLITYLKAQPRFKDYDFLGSDINVLLDILTVNTFRNAFFLNMAISEGFIDSAQRRNNILSHAKELNYLPRSSTSASANITMSFTATGESQPYIIQKGSSFSTQIKNSNFIFTVPEDLILASANNSFSATFNIFEGPYIKDSYLYDPLISGPIVFKLTNPNVDTSSLTVQVFENGSTVGNTYAFARSLLDLDESSEVYFLQTDAVSGNYEVLFGDGVIGAHPQAGGLIVLDYRVSSGSAANGAGFFVANFDPTGGELTSGIQIVTNDLATGGASRESIETTRFRAPRWFQVQERAIVPNDYEILLTSAFPEISAVSAFGGETLNPPQYGRVVIALALNGIEGLPSSKIGTYTSFIKGRNPLSIQPVFVPAAFTFLRIISRVSYNISITSETGSQIESIVSAAIANYNLENLSDFDVTFYYSPFVTLIDMADPSIVSNQTEVTLYKKIFPADVESNFPLSFGLPLKTFAPLADNHDMSLEKTLSSSNFQYKGSLSQLEDDGAGNVRVVNIIGNSLLLVTIVGTIDYSTGDVNLTGFAVDTFSGSSLQIFVVPESLDISSLQNTILAIETPGIEITADPLSL